MKFKAGDKVRCIQPDHSGNRLNSSHVYTIMRAKSSIVNFGTNRWWYSDRFELISPNISPVVHFHDELFEL